MCIRDSTYTTYLFWLSERELFVQVKLAGRPRKDSGSPSEAGSHRIDFIPIYFSSGNGRVVISMRRRAAPFGPSSVRSLGLVAFFLSNIGIMPTTIQLPGSERTSSSIQPKDTVTTNVSGCIASYSYIYLHDTSRYMQIHSYTYASYLDIFWSDCVGIRMYLYVSACIM
jgi:hypothetical protein